MPNQKASSDLVITALKNVIETESIAALVTLIEAPANIGAKLLVEESGAATGSLGNANIDAAVVAHAQKFLESREEARTFTIKEFAPEVSDWSNARLLFERLQPEQRLVVCGAGHVGAALARLAHATGYRATLIDDRAEFVTRQQFPDEGIELIAAENWPDAVSSAVGTGRGVSVAIVTRGHNEDEACLRALVGLSPDYVGLIGSKRRTNIVLERLRETGATEDFLQGVHAPIGLDIAAVTPEEVALSILAEIVAHRRGGQGGSLSAWRRKED